MDLPAGWTKGLSRWAMVAVVSVGLVGAIWQLGVPARAAERSVAGPAGPARIFGGPLRPARFLRLAFGSPEAKSVLLEGFEPSPAAVAPAGANLVGKRGVLQLSLAPDPAAMELIVLGRTVLTERARLELSANGTRLGELSFGPELSLARLSLPGPALVSDRNRIELVRADGGSGAVTWVAAWLSSASSSVTLDVGRAPAGAVRGGWSAPELVDGRSVRRVVSQATASLDLRALPTEYTVLLEARATRAPDPGLEVGMSLSGKHLSERRVTAAWSPIYLPVNAADVPRAHAELELLPLQSAEGDVLIERVGLLPLLNEQLVDIGRNADRIHVASGVSVDEVSADRDGAWSEGAASRLLAVVAPLDEPYTLSLAAKAYHPLAPLAVSVTVNQHPLGTLPMGAEMAIHELAVPRHMLMRGVNEVVLSYPRTMAPARAEHGSADRRELGVFLDWLELRPASHGPPLATPSVR